MQTNSPVPGEPILILDGNQATIRLCRPEHHNRIEPGDVERLCELFSEVEHNRSVRVLILTASGPSFCSGYNLHALADGLKRGAIPSFERMVDQLEAIRVPTVCGLNGSVYGGAVDLALACDFRIGVKKMEMLMPASRMGIHYYYGGLRRCVMRLGLGAANRMFLCAEKIPAAELLRMGFLDQMVAARDLSNSVNALAGAVTTNAPAAVQGMKKALNEIASGAADVKRITRAWVSSMRSKETAEGVAIRAGSSKMKKRRC